MMSGPTASAAGTAHFLAPDGRLQAELELRDAQSGVAGVTGTAWTIATDGRWTKALFFNERVQPPTCHGTLSQKQLTTLAQLLTQYDFATLLVRFGVPPPANPHTLDIRFDDVRRTLTMRAEADRQDKLTGRAARFQSLFEAITRMLHGDDKPCE